MATFFGEVVLPSSRAFWDDEDEYDEEFADIFTKKTDLQIISKSDAPEYPSEIELFLVVHGPLSEGFAKTCLLHDATLKAEIIEVSVAGAVINPDIPQRKKLPSSMYIRSYLKSSVVILLCSPDLDIKQAHPFTETISPWLKISKQVIVLSCAFGSSYLTDTEELPPAFIRELHTDSYKDKLLYNRLEQPNIVSGIPAGVLSWCQIFTVPAILYVSFTDSYITDSITTKPLIKLFNELPLKLLNTKEPMFKKRLYDGPESASNLYL